jgi:hypothetical protein
VTRPHVQEQVQPSPPRDEPRQTVPRPRGVRAAGVPRSTGPRLSRRRCRRRDAGAVHVKHRPTNCGGVERDRSARLRSTYRKVSYLVVSHGKTPFAIAGCLLAPMENTTASASGTHRAGSPIPISGPTLPSPTSAQRGSYRRISCRQRRWCTTVEDVRCALASDQIFRLDLLAKLRFRADLQ